MDKKTLVGVLAESPPNPWMLSDLVLLGKDGSAIGFIEFSDPDFNRNSLSFCGRSFTSHCYEIISTVGIGDNPLPLYSIIEFSLD